ncbi:MarR family winged helix-turn-helix transcriptional regulator [Dactylosporangium matsuzakiense]|uniref:HTH marR-type domain-containing protein n=1 Tax=Dactylosporangium matsuzakiense TaxID=53360 RepID=A0A9W6KVE4_9ACTN|nr:MarR family transcriptional regulator [Dactylosporangium matsuzakiense]GLL08013.1 hypothetical protein GCM10017581_097730 [Dactylosporangium matsuzakiense]
MRTSGTFLRNVPEARSGCGGGPGFGLQAELFARAAALGFDDVGPRHGAVLAYLDEEGIRLADLARLAGRNKQTIAAILDELEQLGYVHRTADPADRRAKLIRPTERGRAIMRISDEIVADIEARHARRLAPGRTRPSSRPSIW